MSFAAAHEKHGQKIIHSTMLKLWYAWETVSTAEIHLGKAERERFWDQEDSLSSRWLRSIF